MNMLSLQHPDPICSPSLQLLKCHHTPILVGAGKSQHPKPFPVVPTVQLLKPFGQLRQQIPRLHETLFPTHTIARATTKRHELPLTGLDGFPAVGVERFNISTIYRGFSMQRVERRFHVGTGFD